MPFDIEEARSRLDGLERADAAELRQRIAALAHPRMTGTEGAVTTEAELRERMDALGYRTQELGFSFSTLPGRFGITVSGALLALTGIFATWLLLAGLPMGGLVLLAAGMTLAAVPWAFTGAALDSLPWGRVDAANLLFTRPDRRPSWILMAHRDTKSQLVPTLIRTGAVITALSAWAALMVLGALWLGGELFQFETAVWIAGVALVASGLTLALSWSTNESPGALDNASGMAALLAVAEGMETKGDVGFLFTDGEELGLAGARAVVEALPPIQGVINVDGLDDRGRIYVAEGHGWGRKGSAPQLAAALLTAGAALDLPVERRRLPRTFMVDHLPIAAAGVPALTVLRGGRSSLMRVHRPGDRAESMTGRGAAEVATLLTAAVTLLRGDERSGVASQRAIGS